jgi:hypothetical protein
MRKVEVGMRNAEWGRRNLKHRAKSIAHRVEQRTVLRFRVSEADVRGQMTEDR